MKEYLIYAILICSQEERKEYDVYVNDPQPLDEGEEKHVISAFVADESGMINRVAGVFARRGDGHHAGLLLSWVHERPFVFSQCRRCVW